MWLLPIQGIQYYKINPYCWRYFLQKAISFNNAFFSNHIYFTSVKNIFDNDGMRCRRPSWQLLQCAANIHTPYIRSLNFSKNIPYQGCSQNTFCINIINFDNFLMLQKIFDNLLSFLLFFSIKLIADGKQTFNPCKIIFDKSQLFIS